MYALHNVRPHLLCDCPGRSWCDVGHWEHTFDRSFSGVLVRRPTSTMLALVLAGGVLPLGASALGSSRHRPPLPLLPTPAEHDRRSSGGSGVPFEQPKGVNCLKAKTEAKKCKPAAMAMAALPNESVLYYDGLEGMRNVDYNVVLEFSNVAENDQSRVMDPRPA